MNEDTDVTLIKAVSLSIRPTIKYSGVSGQFHEWHNMVSCVNMVVFLYGLGHTYASLRWKMLITKP